AAVDDIFGFLIGSWDLTAVLYDAEGRTQRSRGEIHASWVLEGRAIQDLFIFPRRALPARGDRYATTIRTYDRMLNAWRVNFINPAADETSAQLIARRHGQGIEMEGKLSAVHPFAGVTRPSRQRPSTTAPRNMGATASPGNSTWSYSESHTVLERTYTPLPPAPGCRA